MESFYDDVASANGFFNFLNGDSDEPFVFDGIGDETKENHEVSISSMEELQKKEMGELIAPSRLLWAGWKAHDQKTKPPQAQMQEQRPNLRQPQAKPTGVLPWPPVLCHMDTETPKQKGKSLSTVPTECDGSNSKPKTSFEANKADGKEFSERYNFHGPLRANALRPTRTGKYFKKF